MSRLRKYLVHPLMWPWRLMAGARNLLWVALITVLIWVYADMESTSEQEFHATLRLTTGKSQNLMLLGGNGAPSDIPLTFSLRGTHNGLQAFQDWLRDRGSVLTYDVSDYTPSKTPISERAATVLSRVADLTKRGLTLASAEPAAVGFRLDKRIRRDNIPVDFKPIGGKLAGLATIKPSRVSISLSESAWSEIEKLPEDQRKLWAKPVDLKTLPLDKPFMVEVIPSIVVQADKPPIHVDPDPDSVQVEVQVQEMVQTRLFKITPRILLPVNWTEDETWSEYRLVRSPTDKTWTREITVRGPKADIDGLKPEDIDAYVMLGEDDKKPVASFPPREVTVRFPPNVNVEIVGEKPTVSFKLEKRNASPTPPP